MKDWIQNSNNPQIIQDQKQTRNPACPSSFHCDKNLALQGKNKTAVKLFYSSVMQNSYLDSI